jgi:hypothetical protein
MSSVFERYKANDDWLVLEGLPDTKAVRTLLLCVSVKSEASNIQPRLGDSVLDVAFKNLQIPEGTEDLD